MMTIVYLIALVSVVQCAHPPPLGATHVPSETRSRKPLPILQNSNHTCGVDEVKCINGMCILAKWACDTYDDCGDWSDEYSCGPKQNGCPVSRFDCGQGQCISKEFVCDGEKDCANGRDEVHCDKTPCAQDGAFRCQDGDKCLPAEARCDGKADCQDGADEKDCPGSPVKCQVSQFKCKNGACIDKELVCNNEKTAKMATTSMGVFSVVKISLPARRLNS
ncbi:Low-density lipoprotein receptor-related protein 1B [Halotydeus destructor]|nr:Low-density lipoprotein receptor-related protein 1B [Halotydeus destructor]